MKKSVKQFASGVLAATMLMGGLASCGSSDTTDDASAAPTGAITVVSREDGSGTRSAFTELLGIVDADENDATTSSAEITNSTAVMLTTVAGDKQSIGYVSLGSLSDDVKAVTVDGAEASVDTVKDGSYKVSRPFNICYKDGLSDVAQDFINYILSADGQKIISDEGYISIAEGTAYTASNLSGTISISGSTSVGPVMEVLADAYKALNPNVSIEIEQTGSSAGIQSATEGVCDIGMSSRDLTDDEAATLTATAIAKDGIAVIVNNSNTISNLTSEQIQKIFLGETTTWDEVQ